MSNVEHQQSGIPSEESPPPTNEIGITRRPADRVKEAFETEADLVEFLQENGTITDIDGIGESTSSRIHSWFKRERPVAHRKRIENAEGVATVFYEHDEQDHDDYLWGFICPRCESKNSCHGDPDGFGGRPYPCDTCNWVSLIHPAPLNEFINRVKEADTPEWLPESYDPDDDLWERVEAIDEIEGAAEAHVLGVDGTRIVVGTPHKVTEAHDRLKLCAGGEPNCWKYEIAINPGDTDNRLHAVDMEGDIDDNSNELVLSGDFDVRLFGVDAPEITEKKEEAAV